MRDNVALAMRRLSIIDLAGGKQPIFNETGEIAVVCNGEIYNHRELRRDLEAKGHRFASHSDVETIVHGYEEYGLDCLQKLRGMFAIALWDGRSGRLLLVRDRMGEKPLYLLPQDGDRVWFSSELQSLRSVRGRRPSINPEAFNLFLTFQYVPEETSILDDVVILPAGHYVQMSSESFDLTPHRYWNLEAAAHPIDRPIETVQESLDEACRLMGTADVPVAVALSGGIDSSLVAAMTARHFPGQLRAFTVGYKGRPHTDERRFAEGFARSLGIEFQEVELDTEEVVAGFPSLVAEMDTPVGDIAAYGYFSVCRAARAAGFPVLLSGMGGDEFFWGYQWVREAVNRNEQIRSGVRSPEPWYRRILQRKARRGGGEFFGVHPDLRRGDEWSRSIMPKVMRDRFEDDLWLRRTAMNDEVPVHLAITELLNRTWLRSNCLTLMDRMSMANSVEVRLPLLDIDLVEKVTGMRNSGLTDWRQPHKWLLIEALKEQLPRDLLSRNKQGFTPPSREWMQRTVRRYHSLLRDGALVHHGLVDGHALAQGPVAKDDMFMYKLILLECWARIYVEGQGADQLLAESVH